MRSLTMPILLPTSSFKTTATVIIAGVFSLAAAVSFTVPSVSHVMASCFLIFYDNTVFLVKPPYLYLVTNCIIVSIVATSKLTQKASARIDDPEFSDVVTPETFEPVPSDIDTGYLNVAHVVSYAGVEENDAPVEDVSEVNSDDNVIVDSQQDKHAETEKPKPSSASPTDEPKPSSGSPEPEEPKPSSGSPEPEEPKPKSDSPAVSNVKPLRKPPRFSQQRSLKNIEEGIYSHSYVICLDESFMVGANA